MKKRVVVTGMGTVNPLGLSVDEFWKNSLDGVSGVSDVTHLFPIPDHMSQIAGEVKCSFQDPIYSGKSRNQIFVDIAVKEALNQSHLVIDESIKSECAVVIATAIAEISMMEEMFAKYGKGEKHINFVPKEKNYLGKHFQFNNVAEQIAQNHLIEGGALTVSTGCTGGNDAIGYALHMIRDGQAKAVISGAVDAPITPLVVSAFGRIGATSLRNTSPTTASRPYDSDRDGFVLAEGCGILILEELEFALQRGAPILAEVAGFGSVNNCYHMVDIPSEGEAISKACSMALKDGNIAPEEVDFINTHGSSTPQNDVGESNALHHVFGKRAAKIPVTSIKSQLGHPLSAANSIELISSVLSILEAKIPPTINLVNQDPRCKLNVVANIMQEQEITTVMKPSSGFSGIHSCVILKKRGEYGR